MKNTGIENLLLHIVQCWCACAVEKYNQSLPLVLYCSGIMYKHYPRLGVLTIKISEEGKNIHNEILNNIPHIIKNCLHVNFLQDDFLRTIMK